MNKFLSISKWVTTWGMFTLSIAAVYKDNFELAVYSVLAAIFFKITE